MIRKQKMNKFIIHDLVIYAYESNNLHIGIVTNYGSDFNSYVIHWFTKNPVGSYIFYYGNELAPF